MKLNWIIFLFTCTISISGYAKVNLQLDYNKQKNGKIYEIKKELISTDYNKPVTIVDAKSRTEIQVTLSRVDYKSKRLPRNPINVDMKIYDLKDGNRNLVSMPSLIVGKNKKATIDTLDDKNNGVSLQIIAQ